MLDQITALRGKNVRCAQLSDMTEDVKTGLQYIYMYIGDIKIVICRLLSVTKEHRFLARLYESTGRELLQSPRRRR